MTNRRLLRATAVSLAILATTGVAHPSRADDDAAMQFVAAAFDAQSKATRQGSELQFRRGTAQSTHVFEQVLPDRLHGVITSSGGHRVEFYSIRDRQYTLKNGRWKRYPSMGKPQPRFDLAAFFADRISGLAEVPAPARRGPPRKERTFRGLIAWYGEAGENKGRIDIAIDKRTTLPVAVSFDGLCGGVPCSFVQRFRYDSSITIQAPVQ